MGPIASSDALHVHRGGSAASDPSSKIHFEDLLVNLFRLCIYRMVVSLRLLMIGTMGCSLKVGYCQYELVPEFVDGHWSWDNLLLRILIIPFEMP